MADIEGRAALIVYITAGFPGPDLSIEYMMACVEAGADVLEIGVPFSDPVADGPVIQAASDSALRAGVTPRKVLDLVTRLRERTDVPVVLMGYYNPILQFGESKFIEAAANAGVDGLIVADLPLEEASSLSRACNKAGVDLIQLAAPTSGKRRMAKLALASKGYLYLVSRLGTTGQAKELDEGIEALIEQALSISGKMPVAVGFGISSPAQVAKIVEYGADGVIVGSSVLKRMSDGEPPAKVAMFVKELRMACVRK